MLSKQERFTLFLSRLAEAQAPNTHDEVFDLISHTLNKVEDDHSGVPFDPTSWQSDGRMYPPQSDMARASEEHAGLMVYRSRGHRTFIAANGAIKIAEVVSKKTVFQTTGADGKPAPE